MITPPEGSTTHPAFIVYPMVSSMIVSARVAKPDPGGATGSGSTISAVKLSVVGGLDGIFVPIALTRTRTVIFPVQIVGTVDE